jgi:hypothetical protein
MPRYICLHLSGFRVQREACPAGWTQGQLSGKLLYFSLFLKGKKGESSFERGDTVGKYIFKSILNRYLLRTHLFLVGFAAMHGEKKFCLNILFYSPVNS